VTRPQRYGGKHLTKAATLRGLSQALLKPLRVRCEVSADAAFLPAAYCELLGLVIAELVTNAAKHAFRRRDDGVVRIEFANTTDTWACIVSDNGVGALATSSGVGSKFLGHRCAG
jgi:two-component sensor histidine kinase